MLPPVNHPLALLMEPRSPLSLIDPALGSHSFGIRLSLGMAHAWFMAIYRQSGWRPRAIRLASLALVSAGILILGSAWPEAVAERVVMPLAVPIELSALRIHQPSPEAPRRAPRHLFRIPGDRHRVQQLDQPDRFHPVRHRIQHPGSDRHRRPVPGSPARVHPGAPFGFGDLVEIEGAGVYQVEDTMALRHRKRADIWFSSTAAATRWGKRHLVLGSLNTESVEQERRLQERYGPQFEAQFTD